jgi:predicted metal-dependent peptidase
MNPKRKSYSVNFGCLLDTSGSMSQEDMAFGISQLQSLDDRAEGTLVCADSEIYWNDALKIKTCKPEELSKITPKGRGGTIWSPFFADYEKEIGKCDFLIVLTDGYLDMQDVANMRDPGIDVYWIITSGYIDFTPPFGRVMQIRA